MPEPKNVIYGLFALDDPQQRIRYVGQTVRTARRRVSQHIYKALNGTPGERRRPVSTWIRSIGPDAVGYRVLEALPNQESLNAAEIAWISRCATFTMGFNSTTGGDGAQNYRHSDAAIAASRQRTPDNATHEIMSLRSRESLGLSPSGALSIDDVVEIKKHIWNSDLPGSQIAILYETSESTISKIARGDGWKYVPWPMGPRRRPYLSTSNASRFRGAGSSTARLTEGSVRDIRSRHDAGESAASLSREFGVTSGAVLAVIHRQTWKHVA